MSGIPMSEGWGLLLVAYLFSPISKIVFYIYQIYIKTIYILYKFKKKK